MYEMAPEVVSIAEACLGGLQSRSVLLIGSEEQRYPYIKLLHRAGMKYIYQEETASRVSYLLPHVQLLISLPPPVATDQASPMLTAASIAKGCEGRHAPLFIFDLATKSARPSVEELAGLLPEVCLYTPADLQLLLSNTVEAKAS